MTQSIAGILLALLVGCAKPVPAGEISLAGHAEQGGLLFGIAPPGTSVLRLGDVPVRLAGDGRFVVGFGRDAPASAILTATLADGRAVTRTVDVEKRTYQVESIPSLHRPTTGPSPEYEAMRAPELAMITGARTGETSETGWTQAFEWPAQGRISGVYGSQRILGGVPSSPHYGVDIAAPAGTPIVAPADGIVRQAGQLFSLEGNLVMIDHGHGLGSAFLHLSRVDVVIGEQVKRGQTIGAIGTTGRSTGPHLHWGMTWHDVKIDPQLLVGAMPGAPEATKP
ncbi:M23 family metallopeptidase [Sphingosinicellaceae bacterium]|nr:M23 family metallopeptidase [Sphingosinicellaceae bacterium]